MKTTKPELCSSEGSGCEEDFCARRGVRREHIRHGSVSAERRSPCAKRSSKHDRTNCMVTALGCSLWLLSNEHLTDRLKPALQTWSVSNAQRGFLLVGLIHQS